MQTKRKIEMKCFMLRIIIHVLKYSRFSGKINFFKVLIKANQNLVHLIVWTFELKFAFLYVILFYPEIRSMRVY